MNQKTPSSDITTASTSKTIPNSTAPKGMSSSAKEKSLYLLLSIVISSLMVTGLVEQGIPSALKRLLQLQIHPARLIADFTLIGGTGAALINSALVGAIGLILIKISRVRLSGPTIAAVFTLIGFGFFGKTPLNITPIILGVFLSARLVGKKYNEYILISLFGTALGPLVTFVVAELGFSGLQAYLIGTSAGITAGFILPPVATAMLRLHQGYNLYNMGLTCGFIGLFAAGLFVAGGNALPLDILWNTEPSPVLSALIPTISTLFILWGIVMSPRKFFADFLRVQKLTGRLPQDFMSMVSPEGSLVNIGLLGLASWTYVLIVGAPFNGPVLAGIFTICGFGAFGKHVRNSWPVVAGVVISCLVFGKDLASPGPILATLFVTTLAPIAGEFGVGAGLVAGFLHLVMVERSASWHGGFDLYNNGFAGGLTATLVIAVIEWYRSNKPDKSSTHDVLFKRKRN